MILPGISQSFSLWKKIVEIQDHTKVLILCSALTLTHKFTFQGHQSNLYRVNKG